MAVVLLGHQPPEPRRRRRRKEKEELCYNAQNKECKIFYQRI
jgi:hypothetical protein